MSNTLTTTYSSDIATRGDYRLNVTLTPVLGVKAIQDLWHLKITSSSDGIAPFAYEFCLETSELGALNALINQAVSSAACIKQPDLDSGEFTHQHSGDCLGI